MQSIATSTQSATMTNTRTAATVSLSLHGTSMPFLSSLRCTVTCMPSSGAGPPPPPPPLPPPPAAADGLFGVTTTSATNATASRTGLNRSTQQGEPIALRRSQVVPAPHWQAVAGSAGAYAWIMRMRVDGAVDVDRGCGFDSQYITESHSWRRSRTWLPRL